MAGKARIALIALWPVLVLTLLIAARAGGAVAAGAEGERLRAALNWLAAFGGLYLVGYAAAWFTRHSWTAALVRSLLWAVAAFVCIGGIADMFAEHRDLTDRMFGGGAEAGPGVAVALRWRLGCWLVGLGMAATGIGVGFEARGGGQGSEASADDDGG
ncbi:MAG TPA: hypothetical protein VM389_05080 [Phycisphaerae bacterium]|nr:hypothetical protein [Phycisphaerae bacterium]